MDPRYTVDLGTPNVHAYWHCFIYAFLVLDEKNYV